MLSHAVHYVEGSTVTQSAVRLRGYGERIDQGLGVMTANVCEQIVNVTSDVRIRCLNASNDL